MLEANAKQTLRVFLYHIFKYPKYAIGILFVAPLTTLVQQFLPPLILANVLNRLAKGEYKPHAVWSSFGGDLILYAFLMLFGGIVMWRIVDELTWRLEGAVQRDLAQRIYEHLLSQSANFHANTFSGSLVSQTNKLLASYIRFADTTIFQVLQLFFGLIIAGVILLGRAPLFTALFLIFAIVYIGVAIVVTRHVRDLGARLAVSESAQTGYLADSMTNIMAIKSFAGSDFEKKQFAKKTGETRRRLLALMKGARKQNLYLTTINNTVSALSLTMAVIGVLVFKTNLATVYLILSYTTSITSQLWTFGTTSLRNYNRAFGDGAEMVKMLQLEPEVKEPKNPQTSRIAKGNVEFRDVQFTHQGAGEVLFHNLGLKIPAGQKVGVVGHSGSGKTTFMRLLLRFSDIQGGEILIDDQNIAQITQDDLRRAIAYVPQEPLMFHRSLSENIRYGQFEASDAQVQAAAKAAHAKEFIDQLPLGYETLVGERGIKLSGGQRQRIAIARAILKNAPILVLDEATSALDSESEILIQDALWKLMEKRTAVVIAHRLSTIQKMDRIVVLEEGQIVEEGTHKELVNNGGVYAQLWAHQSGGFIDE